MCEKTNSRVLLLAAVLGLSFTAHAQKLTWSLEQCIAAARSNNLQVQRTKLNSKMASENLLEAKGSFLPNVNLFGQTNLNFGQTIDPFTNTFATDEVRSDAYGVTASWNIFNGLQNYNRYKSSQFEAMASLYDADKVANDISLQVAGLYLEILMNKEMLSIAQQQIEITQKQLERSQKLFEAGSVARNNLLEVESQLAREELNQVTAENNLELSYLSILLLMRMDTVADFEIIIPSLEEPEPQLNATADHVYFSALQHLPEVKSAEVRIEGSKHSLSAERGRISPQLLLRGSLGSGYSGKNGDPATMYFSGQSVIGATAAGEQVYRPSYSYANSKPFTDQVSDNFNQSFGFQLNVPLFNGFSNTAAAGRAKVNYEIQKNQYEQTKYTVNETVKRAFYDARAAGKTYLANKKARESAAKSFEFADKRFEVGMMNAFEYNQIKTSFTQSEAQLTRAKYEYVFRIKVLEFYQGKPLSFR